MRKVIPLLLLLFFVVACDGGESGPPTLIPRTTTIVPTPAPPSNTAIVSPTVDENPPTPIAAEPTPEENDTQPTPAAAVNTPSLPSFNLPMTLTVAGQPVLVADTTPSNKLLASTAKGLYLRTSGNDDADPKTWKWQQVGDRSPLPNLLAVDDETLLAGDTPQCGSGKPGVPLIVSTDGGVTWSNSASDVAGTLYARPVDTNGDDLFAVSCSGVFRSTDNATSWQRQTDLTINGATITDLAVTFNGETMYFTATGESGESTIYRSDIAVSRWTAPLQLISTWGASFVRIGPPDQSLYYGSPLGLNYRAAGGADWALMSDGLQRVTIGGDPRNGYRPTKQEQSVGMFDLLPTSDMLLLATSDGIYGAAPGQSWSSLALAGTPVYHLFYGPGGLYAETSRGEVLLRTR